MEKLFTTDLMVNGSKTTYEVVFENDQYVFYPQQSGQQQPFAIKREEDEWHAVSGLEEGIRDEAVASLERYLLAQH